MIFTDRNKTEVARWDEISKNPQALWDALTPPQRQRVFENKFYTFKTWENLTAQERSRVSELAKMHGDYAFINGAVKDVIAHLGGAL